MTSMYSYLFKAFYDWLCDNGANPRILVDATKEGVEVPKEYVTGGMILISIYHLYVKDFNIGPNKISFYTRFKGKSEYVAIPYSAMTELICPDTGLTIPMNMWLASIDLACHQFDLSEYNGDEALMRELDRHSEAVCHESNSSKIRFIIEPEEGDNVNGAEGDDNGADSPAEASAAKAPDSDNADADSAAADSKDIAKIKDAAVAQTPSAPEESTAAENDAAEPAAKGTENESVQQGSEPQAATEIKAEDKTAQQQQPAAAKNKSKDDMAKNKPSFTFLE